MSASRISVDRLRQDMDRYIDFMESTRKRKPERILLTKKQYDAFSAKYGTRTYRDVRLEVA